MFPLTKMVSNGRWWGLRCSAAAVVLILAANPVSADTFLWNGSGVSGGTGDPILNTAANWSPTTTPGVADTGSIGLSSSASLGQSAPLTIGTVSLTTLSGGTLALSDTNTFTNLSVNGLSTVILTAETKVTNSYSTSGGAVVMIQDGGILNLTTTSPSVLANGGTLLMTSAGTAKIVGGNGFSTNAGTIRVSGGGTLQMFVSGSTGLVGLWHFNSDFTDSSSSGDHNGSPVNGTTATMINTTSQLLGSGAGSFNGSNQYISLANNNASDVQLYTGTMFAWVKTTDPASGSRGIIVKSNAFGTWVYNSNLQAYSWGGGGWRNSGTTVNDGNWHQIALSFQSGVANGSVFYVDGTAYGTTTYVISSQTIPLEIGRNTNAQYFLGLMDEAALFNRALSADEIAAYYNGGAGVELSDALISNYLGFVSPVTQITNGTNGRVIVDNSSVLDAISGPFVNLGTVTINDGGFGLFTSVNNLGTIELTGSAGTLATTGAFSAGGDSVLNIGVGTVTVANGFDASGNAVINLTGGGLSVTTGGMDLGGNSNLNVNGGRLSTGGGFTISSATASATFATTTVNVTSITNGGVLIVDYDGTFATSYHGVDGGSLSIATGRTATITSGVSNTGNIFIESGATLRSATSSETFTNGPGGIITLKSGNLSLTHTIPSGAVLFSNAGAIVSTAPSTLTWTWAGNGVALYTRNSGSMDFSAGGKMLFQIGPVPTNYLGVFQNSGTIIVGDGGLELRNDNLGNLVRLSFSNGGLIDARLGTLAIGGAGTFAEIGGNPYNAMHNVGTILLGNAGMTLSAAGQYPSSAAIFTNTGVIRYTTAGTGSLDFEGHPLGTLSQNRISNLGTMESVGGGTFELTRSQVQATLTATGASLSANQAVQLGGVYRAGSYTAGAVGNDGTIVLPGNFLGISNTGSITNIGVTGGLIIEGTNSGIVLNNGGVLTPLDIDTIRTNRGILQFGPGKDTFLNPLTFNDSAGGKLIANGASVSATGLLFGTMTPGTVYGVQNGGTLILNPDWATSPVPPNFGVLAFDGGGEILFGATPIQTVLQSNGATGLIQAGGSGGGQYIFSSLRSNAGSLNALSGGELQVNNGGLFQHTGLIQAQTGGSITLTGVGSYTTTSTSTIAAVGGHVRFVGTGPAYVLTNTGTLRVDGAGSSFTVSGATFTPSSTGDIAVINGGVLDLSSGGDVVYNNTPGGAGKFVLAGGNLILSGSITNEAPGGSFTFADHVVGFGTITMKDGIFMGLPTTWRAIGAVGGTLTIDNAPGVVIRNILWGPNPAGASAQTLAFVNSFTFSSSGGAVAYFQPLNNTYVVAGGAGTISLVSEGSGVINLLTAANTFGTFVGAIHNTGTLALAGGGSAFTITNGLVNVAGGTVRGDSASMYLNADVVNQGRFVDVRGTIDGTIVNEAAATMSNVSIGALNWEGLFTNHGSIREGYMKLSAIGGNSQFVNTATVESVYANIPTNGNGAYSLTFSTTDGGTITNEITGVMFSSFGTLHFSNAHITNRGTISGTSGQEVAMTDSTITNEVSGQLLADGGPLFLENSYLANSGTVKVSSGGMASIGTVTSQTGAIVLEAGASLKGTQDWTNAGLISLDSASELRMNSSLVNEGTILKTGSALGKIGGGDGLSTNAGVIQVNSGTLSLNLATGLVGLWHFDNTFDDASAFSHPTVEVGALTDFATFGSPITPKIGSGAGSFAGSDSHYLTVANGNSITNIGGTALDPFELTVETWLNVGTSTDIDTIASKGLSYLFAIRNDLGNDPLQFWDFGFGKNVLGTSPVASGTWVHVAVTAGANGLILYLNGTAVGTNTAAYSVGQTSTDLFIGRRQDAGGWSYRGLIDDYAVFNRALPNTEILAHYNWGDTGASLTESYISSVLNNTATFSNHPSGNVVISGSTSVLDLSVTPLVNLGTIELSSGGMLVLGTVSSQTGTITSTDSIISALQDWTNNGYIAITHSEIRTREGVGLFTNANYISTGSSINSNFLNAGTFTLTDNTSITGNFTNAGWTNLAGNDLTVNGSINANTGDGITSGVLRGGGTYTLSPADGEATFANDITSAAAAGGNYDTRDLTFNMESGTINFEVTSTDMGSGAFSQLANGYAMGTLTLPNTLTFLRLLDDTINQGGGTQEAIYVENLHLGTALTASNFDFNSNLKIYYNHIVGDGGGDFVGTLDGAERIIYFGNIIPMSAAAPPSGVVPEPSTFALLLLGLPILWFIWRRRVKSASKFS